MKPTSDPTGLVLCGSESRPRCTGSRTSAVLLVTLCGLFVGCRSSDRRAEDAYLARDYGRAIEFFQSRIDDDVMSYALSNLLLASTALESGRFSVAEGGFADAAKVMRNAPGPLPREVEAAMRRQAGFLYRGDSHEGAINDIYRALLALRRGDYLAARLVLEERSATDNQPASPSSSICAKELLLALATARGGDEESAAAASQRFWASVRNAEPFSVDLSAANVFVWVDVDFGPAKVLGEGGAGASYVPSPTIVDRVVVTINGTDPSAEPWLVVDSVDAARSLKGTDESQEAERLEREVAGGFLALINESLRLFSVWAQPDQDTRYWHLLPARSFAVAESLPAGAHEVVVRAYDSSGQEIEGSRTTRQFKVGAEVELRVIYHRISPRAGFEWTP